MMDGKFKFYVVNLFDGTLKGTNDENAANEFSECDEYYVLDSKNGTWLINRESHDIEEIRS